MVTTAEIRAAPFHDFTCQGALNFSRKGDPGSIRFCQCIDSVLAPYSCSMPQDWVVSLDNFNGQG
jgi:hypothetical protein